MMLVYVYILGKMRNLSKLILLRPRLKEFIIGEVTRCVGREFHFTNGVGLLTTISVTGLKLPVEIAWIGSQDLTIVTGKNN